MSPLESAWLKNLPGQPLGEAPNGYMIEYKRNPQGVTAVAVRGTDRVEARVVWVFGSGRKGQTPIAFLDGRFLEHRVSFYTETRSYGITNGQPNGVSSSASAALGWAPSAKDIQICFGCHSTNTSADLRTLTPGVQCAKCHEGAEQHAQGQGKPVNPGKLTSGAQVRLCGTCHRNTPPTGDENDIANVRFQPLRLMKSPCFTKGGIACTTCHPAHQDAVRNDAAFYNRRCSTCHGAQTEHIAQQKNDNCVDCHMPRSRPHPSLAFTDHFIRVVAAIK